VKIKYDTLPQKQKPREFVVSKPTPIYKTKGVPYKKKTESIGFYKRNKNIKTVKI
jgi:hypothetical protein